MTQVIPKGLCQCGCGRRTNLAPSSAASRGLVRGEPFRYISGHSGRRKIRYVEEDRGHDTPCWIWQLYVRRDGYGQDKVDGIPRVAHLAMWERTNGSVPEGLELDHLCRQRSCVNPDHLEPVTHAENEHRGDVSILTWEQVHEIRRASGETQRQLAKRFGVSQTAIWNVVNENTWRAE